MCSSQEDILIGRVGASVGVQGEVKVVLLTDFPERFAVGNQLVLKTAAGIQVESCIQRKRTRKDGLVVKLEGIETRNEAEKLRDAEIVIDESQLHSLEDGRFYLFDIIGLKVTTDDGRELGEITEVLQGGANDVYVTSTGVCIPALRDVVIRIDVNKGVMVLRPVPGLLPEE